MRMGERMPIPHRPRRFRAGDRIYWNGPNNNMLGTVLETERPGDFRIKVRWDNAPGEQKYNPLFDGSIVECARYIQDRESEG